MNAFLGRTGFRLDRRELKLMAGGQRSGASTDSALWVGSRRAEYGDWRLRGLAGLGFEESIDSPCDLRSPCSPVRFADVRGSPLDAMPTSRIGAAGAAI